MSTQPRCAVLFALPVDRAEFDEMVAGRVSTDYARLLFRGNDPEQVWAERYSRVVNAAQELIATAKAFGAPVTRKATLADVAMASAANDAVVVLGHWRGWAIGESDFQCEAAAVQAQLEERRAANPHRWRGSMSRAELANVLNELIESGALLSQALDLTLSQLDVRNNALLYTLGRDALDDMLGALIAPGNKVELYDGLHTSHEFERALHHDFAGDLDLATCWSVGLSTLISNRRELRVRVVSSIYAIDPLPACIAVKATLDRMTATGESYGSARLAIEEQLKAVRQSLGAQR